MTVFELGVLSALLLFGQSQPPSPTPGKSAYPDQAKTAPEQPKADSNQQAAKPLSSSINQSGSIVASGNQQQPAHKSTPKAPVDWWAIANTGLNTIFTGGLVWLMFRQWRAMHRQAEYMRDALALTKQATDAAIKNSEGAAISAHAAKSSADALVGIERAWMLVHVEPSATMPRAVKFLVRNHGRTPGWITDIRFDYKKTTIEAVESINYSDLPGMQPENGWAVPPGTDSKTFLKRLDSTGLLSESEDQAVCKGSLLLLFFGILKYRDVFGLERETRFCQRFIPQLGWCLHGPAENNRWT